MQDTKDIFCGSGGFPTASSTTTTQGPQMKKLIAIALLVVCNCSFAQGAIGIDSPNCGRWVKANDLGQKWWLLGFLSGLNSAMRQDVKNDPLKGASLEGFYLWMDNYCKANPLSNLFTGGNLLYAELFQKAKGGS